MSNQVQVLIADDESLARERLSRLVNKHKDFSVCAEAENGAEALALAKQHYPDIVLLDIRMPEMDGIEAAKHITNLEPPPAIIFCTAYDDYALKAFQANAIGYLLKPVREEELAKALQQAQKLSKAHLHAIEATADENSETELFIANTWDGQELIELADIFFFRADHKYLSVVHKQGEAISNQTLKELENKYCESFIRAHRNSLVNRKHIKKLARNSQGGYQLVLSDGQTVDVSRRHINAVRDSLSGS